MLAEPRAVLTQGDASTLWAALDTLGFLSVWAASGGGRLEPEDSARIDRELIAARKIIARWRETS